MAICQPCRDAAKIAGKNLSQLRESYENLMLMSTVKYSGSFEDYIAQSQKRVEELHGRCHGNTHCFCQHRIENTIRDLT